MCSGRYIRTFPLIFHRPHGLVGERWAVNREVSGSILSPKSVGQRGTPREPLAAGWRCSWRVGDAWQDWVAAWSSSVWLRKKKWYSPGPLSESWRVFLFNCWTRSPYPKYITFYSSFSIIPNYLFWLIESLLFIDFLNYSWTSFRILNLLIIPELRSGYWLC